MRHAIRTTVLAASCLAAIGIAGAPAQAAPRPTAVHAPTVACYWTVKVSMANIRSAASIYATVIKTKNLNDLLGGPTPCTSYSGPGGYWYKVNIAGGGFGYVISTDVTPDGVS